MRPFRTLPALLTLACAAPLAAQSGPTRAAIDSLLVVLESATADDDVPDPATCQAWTGTARKLCKGMLALKHGELTASRDDAITAEFELRQVVQEEPQWALGWYGLGIARLQLALAGVTAKEAPLQTLGVSFEAGAGHALVRSLELEPEFAPALSALALAPIPREGASHLAKRLDMLRTLREGLGPAAMVAAAQVERVAGSRDSAVALLRRALADGRVDSGVVQLELARDLHAAGNPTAGREALFAGARRDSEAAQAAYRQELQWVAEPAELVDWDSTAIGERSAWLRHFWGKRDVSAGWPEGTRLIEHYRRVEHAWQHFTLMLPPSGRHKLSTRTGGIDTFVDYLLLKRLLGPEGLSAEAGLSMMRERAATDPPPGLNPAQEIRMMAEHLKAMGLGGPFAAFRTSQQQLDDRGVVWIRYGQPSREVRSAGGEALEVWAYDAADPPLVLQFREINFDGQVGATSLVPSLIDVPGRFRDQFCAVEQSLCALNTDSPENARRGGGYNDSAPLTEGLLEGYATVLTDGGRVSTPVIDRVVREGNEQIARATTTDAHPRPFEAKLAPTVQVHGVIDFATGEPHLLTVFALPGDRLAGERLPQANNRVVYTVRFVMAAIDAWGRRVERDTTRHFAVADPLAGGQHLSGVLAMPTQGGEYTASLLVQQADGRGAVASLAGIGVPRVNGRPWISSLVLGLANSGTTWHSGTRTVPLHPLNAFTAGGAAELYYQLGGLRRGDRYQTQIDFFHASADSASAALSVSFTDEATAERMEVQRTLGLQNLAPGRYRLRVTVSGAGVSLSEVGYLTVVGG